MNITERLECLSGADADPARRSRIKAYAAGAGAMGLLLVLLIGSIDSAHATFDGAPHSLAQVGSDRRE